MIHSLKTLAVAALVALCAVTGAKAATATFGLLPTVAVANPTADVTTGQVFQSIVGSVGGLYRSPWQGSTVDETAADSFYTSISRKSSATYNFASNMTSISFVWGSPDSYNDLDIALSGGAGTVTINGKDVTGTPGKWAEFVTISNIGIFDSVTFRSRNNAFEFANLSVVAVPVPAALPMLLLGVAGLGFVGRTRRPVRA